MDASDRPGPSEEDRAAVASVERWFHTFELLPGLETPGQYDPSVLLDQIGLPESLAGKRVLDIGARDGFFSFEAERRGAEVVALDFMEPERTGFAVASRLLGSEVAYRVDNVYNLSPERFGRFDLVLFLGVLYHLRNPLLALDRIWHVCGGELVLETQIRPGRERRVRRGQPPHREREPLVQFHPGDSLDGDPTNWWSPNPAALKAMVESSCFEVGSMLTLPSRAIVHARPSDDPHCHYWRTLDGASTVDFDRA